MVIREGQRAGPETDTACLVLVSATPALNRQSDYRGLASLLWENMMPPGARSIIPTDPIEFDKQGILSFLPHPPELSPSQSRSLTDAYKVNGWRWWALGPECQRDNTSEGSSAGVRVVKDMLNCVSMRRGMDTITHLPPHQDGRPWMVCPRDGVPAHLVRTWEVGFGLATGVKDEVENLMNSVFQDMMEAKFDDAAPDDEIIIGDDVHIASEDSSKQAMDTSKLRVMEITSMCWLSFLALNADDPVGSMSTEEALEDLVYTNEPLPPSARNALKKKQSNDGQAPPALGAQHTNAILHDTGDGGLSYLQALAIQDPYDFIPTEREAVLKRVLAGSQLNAHVVTLVTQYASRNDRVLILAANPWEQL